MKEYKIQYDCIGPVVQFEDGVISTFEGPRNDDIMKFNCEKEDTKKLFEAMKEYYEQESLKNLKSISDQLLEIGNTETTPNCVICEWELSVLNKNHEIIAHECTAQGFKLCAACYNTTECKKLFQEENDD